MLRRYALPVALAGLLIAGGCGSGLAGEGPTSSEGSTISDSPTATDGTPAGEPVGEIVASWVSGNNEEWSPTEHALADAVTEILPTEQDRDAWLAAHDVTD